MNIVKWLSEYIKAEESVIGLEEVKKRADALSYGLHNVGNLTGDQFKEAMTTAHFASYFTDALSREFFKSYAMQQGTWPQYTYADEAPDFRDVKRFRSTTPGTLFLRREKAEMKATSIEIGYQELGVEEYARQFDVSWRTIMNDDLGEIKRVPEEMAKAAARFEDQFVSALYDNAVTQATLIGLGVPWSGTGRLTAANLAIGINAMMQRVDAVGNPIAIKSIHLVVPPILLIQAQTILESILLAGVATNDKNVLGRYIAGIHVDPYIATAAPNIPWYLFAGPAEIPTVTVLRLAGWAGPVVFRKSSDIEILSGSAPAAFTLGSFATGDIEYGVEDVIGGWDDAALVGVTDPTGIFYSSGTTP